MKKSQLSKAITIALTGSALAFGAVSTASAGTTSYNTFNHGSTPHNLISGSTGTDGWTSTTGNSCGPAGSYCGNGVAGAGIVFPAFGSAAVPWVGNDARTDSNFNYAGSQHLNWTAVLNSTTDSAEVSRNDSFAQYNIYADIDTAKGAWHDNSNEGWKHDSDIGLFASNVTQEITLNIKSLGPDNINAAYGITVFEGMDTTTGFYGHHGSWHAVSSADALAAGGSGALEVTGTDISSSNPFNSSGLGTLVLDDVLNNNAVFTATAGTVYTIIVGGFQGGGWDDTRDYYQLDITGAAVSAVPVPAAAWLLGSGLVGLFSYGRRKNTTV